MQVLSSMLTMNSFGKTLTTSILRQERKLSIRAFDRRDALAAYEKQQHKCAICGRTDEDDENLEFRFCSKCEGNYEYCQNHLFTHEHVKK